MYEPTIDWSRIARQRSSQNCCDERKQRVFEIIKMHSQQNSGQNEQKSDNSTKAKAEGIPIPLKLNLTIKEAAEYSNIGINRLESLLREPGCPFVLFIGTKKLVKREPFEEYLAKRAAL